MAEQLVKYDFIQYGVGREGVTYVLNEDAPAAGLKKGAVFNWIGGAMQMSLVGTPQENAALRAVVAGGGVPGNALFKTGGKPLENGADTTAVLTMTQAWRVPASIGGFRLGFEFVSAAALPPISLARFTIVGAAGNNGTAAMDAAANFHTGTIRDVTFGGAAGFTPPARRSSVRASQTVWSDWMRAEAAAGQTLVYRQLVPFTANWRYTYHPHGFVARSTYLGAVVNPAMSNTVGADWVTPNTNWGINSTNMTGNLIVPFIEWAFDSANPVSVWMFGDSLTAGSVDSGEPAVPPVVAACEALSTSSMLLVPMVGSWPGGKTWDIYQRLLDLVREAPVGPGIVVWQVGSQNNQSDTNNVQTQKSILAAVRRLCRANAIPLIFVTQVPANGTAQGPDDNRKALNAYAKSLGELVADMDAVISDGATPAAYKSVYGSGSHPFLQGYSDFLTQQMIPALSAAAIRAGLTL